MIFQRESLIHTTWIFINKLFSMHEDTINPIRCTLEPAKYRVTIIIYCRQRERYSITRLEKNIMYTVHRIFRSHNPTRTVHNLYTSDMIVRCAKWISRTYIYIYIIYLYNAASISLKTTIVFCKNQNWLSDCFVGLEAR